MNKTDLFTVNLRRMISCLHILKFSNFTPISLLFPSFFFSRNPNDNFFSSKIPQKFKPSPFTEKSPVHLLIFFSFFLNSSKDLGFHHWTKQICKFAFPSKIVAQSIYWKKPSPFTDFFFLLRIWRIPWICWYRQNKARILENLLI